MLIGLCLAALAAPQSPVAPATSPGPRHAHTLVWDESRSRLVLFGGAGGDSPPAWSWNGARWSAIPGGGPATRRSSLAVFDPSDERVLIYGGLAGDDPTSPCFDETWTLEGTRWSRSISPGPGERAHFALGYDRGRGRAVLIGGIAPAAGRELTDVWELDGSTWKRLDVHAPAGLFAPQLAYDEKAKVLVLTSSRPADRKVTTWSFDGTAFEKLDDDGPATIWSGQSLATLGPQGGLLAFGGFDGAGPSAETWRWNGAHWEKLDVQGPSARLGLAMTFDRKAERVLLYGGEDGKQTFDDLWEFSNGSWKEVERAP